MMGICKLGGKIRPARSDQVAEAAMEAAKILPEGAYGPPMPARWRWRPVRREAEAARPARVTPPAGSAFAALAGLVR